MAKRTAILNVRMLLIYLIIPATMSNQTTMSASECKEQESDMKSQSEEVKKMPPSGDKIGTLTIICEFVSACSENGNPPSGFSDILPDCTRMECILECFNKISKDMDQGMTFESEEEEAAYYCPQYQAQSVTDCLKECPSPRDALLEYKGVLGFQGCKNVTMAGEDEVMGEAEVTRKPQAMGGSGVKLTPVAVSAWLALSLALNR